MILPIVKYGHPVLRQKGERVASITPEIRQLVEDMLETMHDASGVGLAAQQIGRALQLAVVDVTGIEDRPSTMEIDGKRVRPEDHMPVVLLNPDITPEGDPVTGPEGCLSFPETYADITRPERVSVKAMNLTGQTLEFTAGGLLARAVQHEVDHLRGILFIDRMTTDARREIRSDLEKLQATTKAELQKAKGEAD